MRGRHSESGTGAKSDRHRQMFKTEGLIDANPTLFLPLLLLLHAAVKHFGLSPTPRGMARGGVHLILDVWSLCGAQMMPKFVQ